MLLIVHLTPKASHNKIEGWSVDKTGQRVLRVKVTTVPEDGKANEALIKLLSKALHISKSRICLIRGATSRTKHFEIDKDEGEAEKMLGAHSKVVQFLTCYHSLTASFGNLSHTPLEILLNSA